MNAIEEFNITTEKLRTVRFRGFEGYRVDKLLTIPAQEVLQNSFEVNSVQFWKSVICGMIKEGYQYDFSTIINSKLVLFYSHCHAMRADYVQFMETVASCYSDAVLFTGRSNKGGLFSNIKIRIDNLKLLHLLLLWCRSFHKANIERKFWRKFLLSLMESYKWKCLLIRNQDSVLSIKSLVSIFDAREYENIFSQFLMRHGIPTATLQHGHFGKEHFSSSNDFYLGIGYRGFVSDYFLLWGESSYRNALDCGIPESKLIKVGCPYLIEPKRIEGERDNIGLLLDGGLTSINDNKNLYGIAKKYAEKRKKKLIVKPHPSYKSSEYIFFIEDDNVEIYDGGLESFAKEVELVFCCNTSCLLTLLIWGIPLLHYRPTSGYDMYREIKDYSFSKYEELENNSGNYISPSLMLSFYTEIEDVKGKYRKAFNKLLTI